MLLQIRVLCGVDHDDLKRLFHVSKPIREAVSSIPISQMINLIIAFLNRINTISIRHILRILLLISILINVYRLL